MNDCSVFDDMTQPEREVAYFLKEKGIYWQFESPLFLLDDKDRCRIYHPDFYLSNLGIYIEVCGTSIFNYEYRELVYNKNNIPIIFIHQYKDTNIWKEYLITKIKQIVKDRFDKVLFL